MAAKLVLALVLWLGAWNASAQTTLLGVQGVDRAGGTNSDRGSVQVKEAWETSSVPTTGGLRIVTRWLPSADWLEVTVERDRNTRDAHLPLDLHQVIYAWQEVRPGQTRFDARRSSRGFGTNVADKRYRAIIPRGDAQLMIQVQLLFPRDEGFLSSLFEYRSERYDFAGPLPAPR